MMSGRGGGSYNGGDNKIHVIFIIFSIGLVQREAQSCDKQTDIKDKGCEGRKSSMKSGSKK